MLFDDIWIIDDIHTYSSWVIDQNNILHGLFNISRTAWPTEILMSFLSFSDNLFQDNYIIFQQKVDNYEIEQKTCSILVWGAFSP